MRIDRVNLHDIIYGDIFYFKYYGINVFLYVCDTDYDHVYVYELAKKKIKYKGETVDVLCPGLKRTRSPKLVNKDAEKYYWLESDYDGIWVNIQYMSPLYKEAMKKGFEYPDFGTVKAIKLEEEREKGILNYYWTNDLGNIQSEEDIVNSENKNNKNIA